MKRVTFHFVNGESYLIETSDVSSISTALRSSNSVIAAGNLLIRVDSIVFAEIVDID